MRMIINQVLRLEGRAKKGNINNKELVESSDVVIETSHVTMFHKTRAEWNNRLSDEVVVISLGVGLKVITTDLSVYDTLLAEYAADTIKAPDDFRGITAKDINVLNFGMPENCPKCGSKLEKEDRKTSHGGIVREMSCKNCSQDTFQKDITELMAVYEGRLVPYGETR